MATLLCNGRFLSSKNQLCEPTYLYLFLTQQYVSFSHWFSVLSQRINLHQTWIPPICPKTIPLGAKTLTVFQAFERDFLFNRELLCKSIVPCSSRDKQRKCLLIRDSYHGLALVACSQLRGQAVFFKLHQESYATSCATGSAWLRKLASLEESNVERFRSVNWRRIKKLSVLVNRKEYYLCLRRLDLDKWIYFDYSNG